MFLFSTLLLLSPVHAFEDPPGATCETQEIDETSESRSCLEITKPGKELKIEAVLREYKNKEFNRSTRRLLTASRIVLHGIIMPQIIGKHIPSQEKYDIHFKVGAAMGAGASGLMQIILSSSSGFKECEGHWGDPDCKKKMRTMRWISSLTVLGVGGIAYGKEAIWDRKLGKGKYDLNDFKYTALGGLTSFKVSFPVNALFRKNNGT
jgi:hypothetical protein